MIVISGHSALVDYQNVITDIQNLLITDLYKMSPRNLSKLEAENFCRNNSMELVTYENQAKYMSVIEWASNYMDINEPDLSKDIFWVNIVYDGVTVILTIYNE